MGDGQTAWIFHNGTWNKTYPFYPGSQGSAISKSPFPNNFSISLFAFGGGTILGGASSASGYFFSKSGWQSLNANAPESRCYHCMILSNLTTVWVIGGINDYVYTSNKVFIFNSVTMKWTNGPDLLVTRYSHTCSMILKNNHSQSLTQIVIGGSNDYWVPQYSVEIFDDQTNSWKYGPVPITIGGAVVNDGNNGIIQIGGDNGDTFYRLRNAESEWELMDVKLKTSRYYPIAFYVPTNITNCT
jgi:N-acetylneuraminic acid mutarotase